MIARGTILNLVSRPRSRLLAVTLLVLAACAPREARIESEPAPGAANAPAPAAGDAEVQSTLRANLREFARAQAEFAEDNGYYAARASDLAFTASSGVRLDVIQGDRNGWSAVAAAEGDECAIYHGSVRPPRGYLSAPDRVDCR